MVTEQLVEKEVGRGGHDRECAYTIVNLSSLSMPNLVKLADIGYGLAMSLTDDAPAAPSWTPHDLILNTREIVQRLMQNNGLTIPKMAEAIGMEPGTLRNRLTKPPESTGGQFTQPELYAICLAFELVMTDFEIPADDPIFRPAKGLRIGRYRTPRARHLVAVS